MMRRIDEEFARHCFARFLQGRGYGGGGTWRLGEDPPDFRLRVDKEDFLVEVTTVVDRVQCGDAVTSDPLVEAVQLEFAEEVRRLAAARSCQSGLYVLDLDGLPVNKGEKQRALSRALDFMGRTGPAARGAREQILRDQSAVWVIEKWPSEDLAIETVLSSSPHGKWGGEIREELPRFLRMTLEQKIRKLCHLGGSRILLLIDRYHLAGSRDWRAALPRDLVGPFHTVARVHGAHECEVLYTKEPSWLPAETRGVTRWPGGI